MVIEINEMIDYLEDFFNNSQHEIVVGGIAGTQIEKYVLDAALGITEFHKILVVNGCQDYLGLMKNPMPTVVFWADLFVNQLVDSLIPRNPWLPNIYNPEPESTINIDSARLAAYDAVVIFNGHLIPGERLSDISKNFSGKIVTVIDPCETSHGLYMYDKAPIIIDTLEKVSPIIAMARSVYGVESRLIDTKVRGTVNEINKMSRRSIGKMDDKQYVTYDIDLLCEIQEKQCKSPLRKNQKVIVSADGIIDTNIENGLRKASIVDGSMLVVVNPNPDPFMKLRLYNSKTTYFVDVSYNKGALCPKGAISVQPGNIIGIYDFTHHRYNHSVLILNDKRLPDYAKYSVLKNSNNVTIVSNVK